MPEPFEQAQDRLAAALQHQHEAYAHGEDRPVGAYGLLTGVYGTVLSLLLLLARRRGLPERLDARDLALLSVATHKLARRVAKDPVTSPLRAPFTRYEGLAADAELAESPRGEGLQHALGELVGCPFCLSQWTATAFVAGLIFAPRPTRLVASLLAVSAGSDALQYVYAGLQRLEE